MGIASSRKIEKGAYHQVPFRVICGDQHPDHDTMAEFRKRHLKSLSGLFVLEQAYNCQAAVDETDQVIVAASVTQYPNDKKQVEPR